MLAPLLQGALEPPERPTARCQGGGGAAGETAAPVYASTRRFCRLVYEGASMQHQEHQQEQQQQPKAAFAGVCRHSLEAKLARAAENREATSGSCADVTGPSVTHMLTSRCHIEPHRKLCCCVMHKLALELQPTLVPSSRLSVSSPEQLGGVSQSPSPMLLQCGPPLA
eukprot:jgi/Mesen1/746/ME000110S_11012